MQLSVIEKVLVLNLPLVKMFSVIEALGDWECKTGKAKGLFKKDYVTISSRH